MANTTNNSLAHDFIQTFFKNKEKGECPPLKVHQSKMNDSKKEKYVFDVITDDGKNNENIATRKAKGFGISGDILAMLKEIPFGPYKVQAGICMRDSMLVNGILTNAETWYGLTTDNISELEKVDEFLLRKILDTPAKTSKELLYLETGTIPIKFLLKARRINYLHNILSKSENELINHVYLAQKRRPIKDDWFLTVQKDLNDLNIELSENEIKAMKKQKF